MLRPYFFYSITSPQLSCVTRRLPDCVTPIYRVSSSVGAKPQSSELEQRRIRSRKVLTDAKEKGTVWFATHQYKTDLGNLGYLTLINPTFINQESE
jgi:hypothetical protein